MSRTIIICHFMTTSYLYNKLQQLEIIPIILFQQVENECLSLEDTLNIACSSWCCRDIVYSGCLLNYCIKYLHFLNNISTIFHRMFVLQHSDVCIVYHWCWTYWSHWWRYFQYSYSLQIHNTYLRWQNTYFSFLGLME